MYIYGWAGEEQIVQKLFSQIKKEQDKTKK